MPGTSTHARPTSSGGTVAVYGATGHTGRFVVAELLRRGLRPVAVGRDAAALAALDFASRGVATRTATIDDPASLDRAFVGVVAVVNCAGPFLDTADAVAAAAMRCRVHYLDVTAEQASARATLDAYDAAAREAGRLVIPAMGFYGGLADLLATAAMGDWTHADDVGIGIALDRWHPTPGTRTTGARNTATRLVISGGRLTPMRQPAAEASWAFPPPFGAQDVVEMALSEVILIARHLRVAELHTHLGRSGLDDLRDPATPPPQAADASGRSAQLFLVDVAVRNGARTRRARAHGRDIYAFSAPLVVEALRRILAGEVRAVGAHAPGAVFDARAFLETLAPDLVSLEIEAD
jgi:short subunit dehydrogenase-like uncharacterized protein